MNETEKTRLTRAVPKAVLTIVSVLLLGASLAQADTQYLGNGAQQNGTTGGWDLPAKGACFPDATRLTRPECAALRFTAASEQACVNIGGTAPGVRSWSTGVCNDTVHTADQATCEGAAPAGSRMWSNGVCAVTMKGFDRNRATCATLGGTWITTGVCTGTWVMPDATTYSPAVISGSYTGSYANDATGTATTTIKSLPYPASPGPGDQCLRCHRSDTEWNVNRVRDVEGFVKTGHQNMSRPVVPTKAWAGPYGIYPTDSSGNVIDWISGKITISGVQKALYWIYDGWFEAPNRPAAIFSTAPVSGAPGASYSCNRCHTTGWTSDASLKATKQPEATWPGITWDGVTAPVAGQVNLSAGVGGDSARKMASWDQWGISCTRCHSSAAENLTGKCVLSTRTSANCASTKPAGTWYEGQCIATLLQSACTAASGTWTNGPPYAAAAIYTVSSAPTSEMSTHHSSLTSGDAGSGYCTDSRFSAKEACIDPANYWPTAGYPGTPVGTWITACSDGVSADQPTCLAAGKTWAVSSCSVGPLSYCSTSSYTSATCATAGGTWQLPPTGAPDYSTNYVCVLPQFTTAAACIAHSGWQDNTKKTAWTNQFGDPDSCKDAGGVYTGSKTRKGQIITALCTSCHRQENKGFPYTNGTCTGATGSDWGTCVNNGGTWNETGGGLPVMVGPYHNTITFPSHFHGNQFLNSPHGRFSGKSSEIATATYMNGYSSHLAFDTEPAGTGAGCTTCHDVHKSTNEAANPAGGAVKECQDCHKGAYAKDLTKLRHPGGVGTPLENMTSEPASPCITCHMPGGQHFFRVNSDAAYSTFPSQVFTNGLTGAVQNANTSPEGATTAAVWVDLNAACGQCHGGGSANATTTGTIAAGSTSLLVANAMGFAPGEAVTIAGANSLAGAPAPLPTFVSAVSGNTVTLVGKATFGVTNATVTLNPTKNGAQYFTKANLGYFALGIHGDSVIDKPVVDFSFALGNPNTLQVNVDGSLSSCTGGCKAFTWTWGDGATDTGSAQSHTYAGAGSKTITLTVVGNNNQSNSTSKTVNVYSPDAPPTAAGTFTFDPNTWIATLVDTSTDATGVSQVTVNWGDGGMVAKGVAGATFTHTYLVPGTFTVKMTVVDTLGQMAAKTFGPVSPALYTIGGTVFQSDGTTPAPQVTIKVKIGAKFVKTVYSGADGKFTATSLKPGAYSLVMTKAGYTFPLLGFSPPPVGPSQTTQTFNATTP